MQEAMMESKARKFYLYSGHDYTGIVFLQIAFSGDFNYYNWATELTTHKNDPITANQLATYSVE